MPTKTLIGFTWGNPERYGAEVISKLEDQIELLEMGLDTEQRVIVEFAISILYNQLETLISEIDQWWTKNFTVCFWKKLSGWDSMYEKERIRITLSMFYMRDLIPAVAQAIQNHDPLSATINNFADQWKIPYSKISIPLDLLQEIPLWRMSLKSNRILHKISTSQISNINPDFHETYLRIQQILAVTETGLEGSHQAVEKYQKEFKEIQSKMPKID